MFTQKQTRGSLWMGLAAVLTMTSAVTAQLQGSATKDSSAALQSVPFVAGSPAFVSVSGAFEVDWINLGSALPGVFGAPKFTGSGLIGSGERAKLLLTNAAPMSLAVIFVSLDSAPMPFKGGTLVPSAPAYAAALTTNSLGQIELAVSASVILPAGLDLVMQYAIADVAAVQGVALSNAIQTSVK